MSPQQKKLDPTTRLLGFWEHRQEDGRPIGCVATTYTFDAAFFEEECLTRFVGIDSDPTEEFIAYVVEREEKLSEVFACVFVDQGHVAKLRSLRWGLLPVRVPGAIQHAKVTLLVWEQRIRLLVGSANLTVPGCQRNFENIGVLDFTPSGETPLSVLHDVLSFFESLRRHAPGGAPEAAPTGPQRALRGFLELVRATVSTWSDRDWDRDEPRVEFLSLGPETASLFVQIRDQVWSGTRPDVVWVLSPFFDQDQAAQTTVESLVEIMGRGGVRQLHFMGQGRQFPDGSIELDLPQAYRTEWLLRTEHFFSLVRDRDQDGNTRRLHAKSLWLERGDDAVYLIGSSNFTGAGTGVRAAKNVEANLAYRLPSGWTAFHQRCEESYPPYDDIELSEAVRFTQSPIEETHDPEAFVPLHPAFGEALFQPSPELGTLILHVDRAAPQEFVVKADEGDDLLTHTSWREQGGSTPVSVSWPHARPPSSLNVTWVSETGLTYRSLWIVNVTDRSQLPPPAELRDLPLGLLLEILSSARPIHETVAKARQSVGSATSAYQLDPHRRVDTSQYLLKRVKRISVALEGLRLRLERPAFSLDAFRWRLEGPVGPIALARRIAVEEPRAAAFLIAELVLLLRRVDWAPIRKAIGRGIVTTEINKALVALKNLAGSYPTARDVEEYVALSFESAGM